MMTNNKLIKIDTGLYLIESINKNKQNKRNKRNKSFLILIPSLLLIGSVSIGYLDLKVKNTEAINTISRLEAYYTKLKSSNDEEEASFKTHIDLNEIKIKAYKLNMQYPKKEQIIYFENIDDDYVVTNF